MKTTAANRSARRGDGRGGSAHDDDAVVWAASRHDGFTHKATIVRLFAVFCRLR